MNTIIDIEEYTGRIAKEYNPEKIILFGSAARKNMNENSDVDILVVMDFKGRAVEQAFQIRKNIPPSFPADIIVRKPEQIRERINKGDFFLREILEEGVVLYERTG